MSEKRLSNVSNYNPKITIHSKWKEFSNCIVSIRKRTKKLLSFGSSKTESGLEILQKKKYKDKHFIVY